MIRPKAFLSRCQRLYRLKDYELQGGNSRKVVVYRAEMPVAQPELAPVPPPVPESVLPPSPTVPGLW